MTDQRVREFVAEYQSFIRIAANEEELRSSFKAAAISKLGIRDLNLERGLVAAVLPLPLPTSCPPVAF